MKAITFLNEKGGVGKTTLSTHVAGRWAQMGKKVLLVDSDPQGSATSSLGLPKGNGFFQLVIEGVGFDSLIKPVEGQANLFCLPSDYSSSGIPYHEKYQTIALRPRIRKLAAIYDYVVFDTQPIPNRVHESIILSSDYVVMVTDVERFGTMEGLPQSLEHMAAVREMGAMYGLSIADVLGIVPNKLRNTDVHQYYMEQLQQNYGDLLVSGVPLTTKIPEAQAFSQFVFDYDPNNGASAAIIKIAETLEKRING